MHQTRMGNMTRICVTLPNKVESQGLWKQLWPETANKNYQWLGFMLPRLEVTIALIFAITQCSHFILRRWGFPLVISQLIAGLFLSPAILSESVAESLMNAEHVQVFGTIGNFGFAFFLFLVGVKMDLSMMVNRASKRSISLGLLSLAAPLVVASLVIPHLGLSWGTMFIGLTYGVTTFPSTYCLLNDSRILNSELGRLGLSSSIVSDSFGLSLVFVGNLVTVAIEDGIKGFVTEFFFVTVYVSFVFYILRPAMKMAINYTPEGRPVKSVFTIILTLLFLLSVCVGKWFHQYSILAPYVLGLAVPHGPPLGSALVEKFEGVVDNLLLPLFVTSCGMRMSTFNIFSKNSLPTRGTALFVVLICAVKFVVSLVPPLYSKMPNKDALALACIISCQGVLQIGIFSHLFDQRAIDKEVYSCMFLIIILLSSIVPMVVSRLYDPSRKYAGYQKRNVMDLKPHSELQIVACIHVPDNVRAVINFLEVACSTKDSPLAVNVLHLVKLRGQATPIFITHQKYIKAPTANYYSENVVVSFDKLEANSWGAVSVNTFTAVSPPSVMQDDICSLALDKLASLIILPFHRRWYIDGTLESEDESIRILNSKVLEKAPCSVGILIDHGNLRRQAKDVSSGEQVYNVAVIFLGGADDREALALGRRMAQGSGVCLTVLNLTNAQDNAFEDWDRVLDSVSLREVKTNGCFNYIEKEVTDGPETAKIIRPMVNEFDLLIVGSRYNLDSSQRTSGLKEWSEFRELGIIGDLLASTDYSGKCSVLILQQQQIKEAS